MEWLFEGYCGVRYLIIDIKPPESEKLAMMIYMKVSVLTVLKVDLFKTMARLNLAEMCSNELWSNNGN